MCDPVNMKDMKTREGHEEAGIGAEDLFKRARQSAPSSSGPSWLTFNKEFPHA
jgi:hypothetical protein